MTKLKKAAFLIVARCLSSEEISGLRQLFKTIDTDNSGTITVDELKVMHITTVTLLCTALLQTSASLIRCKATTACAMPTSGKALMYAVPV